MIFYLPSELISGGFDFIYMTLIIEKNSIIHNVKTDFKGNNHILIGLQKIVHYIEDLYHVINRSMPTLVIF